MENKIEFEYYTIENNRPVFLNAESGNSFKIQKEDKENLILQNQLFCKEIFADENNALYLVDMSKAPQGVKIIYNPLKKIFEETASLKEQKDYYLKKSLEVGKKLEEYKNIGLQGGQEYIYLEKELEVNKNKYIEICHVEALEMDLNFDNTNEL